MSAECQQTGVYTPYSEPAIQIDKFTSKTSSPLPFDKDFNLQYTLESPQLFTHVYVYKVHLKDGKRYIDTFKKNGEFIPVGCTRDTSKGVLTIHINAIPPNTLIDVLLIRSLNADEIKCLSQLNESLYKNLIVPDSIYFAGIRAKYDDFKRQLAFNPYGNHEELVAKFTFLEYVNFFKTQLLSHYQEIKNHPYNTYTHTNPSPVPPAHPILGNINYSDISKLDSELIAKKISDDDLLPLASMVNEQIIPFLLRGLIDVSGNYPQGTLLSDNTDYVGRIANLETAVSYFDRFITLMERAKMSGFIFRLGFYETIINYRRALDESRKLIKKEYQSIMDSIKSSDKLNKEQWLISGNDFNDLTVLSKSVLMPDIGIVTMALHGHDKWQFYPRPFVGVNIYFRPVNKTIKESFFPKNQKDLLRLLGLQVGLTYGKLGGIEFTNLFNDFSLMIGPSFRLARWFRVGIGTILTQQTDVNPIITQTHTYFGYYLAFSFDIDILSNASSLTSRVLK